MVRCVVDTFFAEMPKEGAVKALEVPIITSINARRMDEEN